MKGKGTIILLLIVALLLTACGTKPAETPASTSEAPTNGTQESTPETKDTVEINIMGASMRLESMRQAWLAAIAEFEAQNPGVKVNLNLQGEWDEIPQLLAQARMASQQVDIIRTTGGIIRSTLAPTGALMDLTEAIKPLEDRFVEGTLDNYKVGGYLWGIPYGETTTSVIYYNKNMFAELGLSEPKTLEELVAAADKIKEEKGIRNPWIHQGAIVGYWPMWFAETYGQVTGGNSVELVEQWLSGEKSFNDEQSIEAFRMIREMFEKGVLTNDSLDTDDTAMRALFAQEQAAMFYGGTWEYAPTLEAVGDKFEIGVFQWPSMAEGMKTLACGAADDGLAVASSANKDNWDMIMKFLDFMTSKEVVEQTITPIQPIIPVFKDLDPVELPEAQKLISFMPNTIVFLDWMWPAEINDTLGNQIAGVASGNITPENAAKAVQDTYEKLVRETEYKYNWYDSWSQEQWQEVTPPSN